MTSILNVNMENYFKYFLENHIPKMSNITKCLIENFKYNGLSRQKLIHGQNIETIVY